MTSADELDKKLQEAAQKTTSSFMDFADLAAQAIKEKVFEHFGYVSEEAYFDERIGVGYRTLKRWLQARSGIQALPVEDRVEAKALISKLGVHKAAALAPVLKLAARDLDEMETRPPIDWRAQVKFAGQATTSAVQARATDITGAKPRGMADAPGAGFKRFVLSRMPPSRADFVERVWDRLSEVAGTKHPIGSFLLAWDIVNRDLSAMGKGVEDDAEA
jgi:hypothetical protein